MPTGEQMSFGNRVRDARIAAGMTQLELGRLSGYGRSSIANIEADNQDPTLSGLCALADALKIPPASLLSDEINQGDALKTRSVLRKALMVLDWEAERMRNGADSLAEVAKDIRALLNPADGVDAVSVARPATED